jgi:nicotinate-nucleotide adenylyltransferase
MGLDAYTHFTQWHGWEEILTLANLWVAIRPDSQPLAKDSQEKTLLNQLNLPIENFQKTSHGQIYMAESTAMTLSSSMLRRHFEEQISPEFLMPKKVWHYIQENQLYGVDF